MRDFWHSLCREVIASGIVDWCSRKDLGPRGSFGCTRMHQRMKESSSGSTRTRMEIIQMKRFCTTLTMILLAAPIAGMAQATQKNPQQPTQQTVTPAPAVTTGKPATSSSGTGATAANSPNYAGPMDASRYIIGPEDSLQITVWKEPTL